MFFYSGHVTELILDEWSNSTCKHINTGNITPSVNVPGYKGQALNVRDLLLLCGDQHFRHQYQAGHRRRREHGLLHARNGISDSMLVP
jgi:hypothetical protein